MINANKSFFRGFKVKNNFFQLAYEAVRKMLLTTSDGQAIKEVTLFYSVFSCILLPIFCAILYFSELYMNFGKRTFLPVMMIIVVIEVLKRWFHHFVYEKDFTVVNRRNTSKDGFLKRFDVPEYTKIALNVFVGTVVFFVIAILYGASLVQYHEQTLMFAALMSILTFFPICLHIGRPFVKAFLLRNPPQNMFQTMLYQNVVFTLTGAWLGAFLIPLDWDRPWQVWPVPCSFGALLGYTCSHYLTLVKYFVFGSYSVFFKKKK
ncbi:phosphatidylinositol-glycan biosynthesis class F protein [Cimex lectularius]|uniref:Phosphatidylinositol-glycan biosynthesis class F protein n=1 Tax=Cimex lectularius TaxID=79782 RepID=A0A8I6RPK1_CIMLE|nr:phosphatidylinositol-glycan biosynthesis class F protein [Cimex lectularius]